MKKILIILLNFATLIFSQDTELYSNPKFSMTGTSVREGAYIAKAVSDSEIISNYQPAFQGSFNRLISFKLAINGFDNEAEPGIDHKIYVNPSNGVFHTPLFTFGEKDPTGASMPQGFENPIPANASFDVLFQVDMSGVFKSFREKGYYTLYNGTKVTKDEFKGVYIAGGTSPLVWDFSTLNRHNEFKLLPGKDTAIYEVKIRFTNTFSREKLQDDFSCWKQKKDLSSLPQYKSDFPLFVALHKLSLEELLMDVRKDGAFMAGAKWEGVWTRDISYSTLLSLAIVMPDACKTSLMAKVKDGIIIQDTGTGGSWPVSSDRMIWALAAYEVFLTTGDMAWLQQAFEIINRSVKADRRTLFDPGNGLIRGESSFMDWREQTYPLWMEPVDIYSSECLGTNVVHARTYAILAEMADILGKNKDDYHETADSLRRALNKNLWLSDKGYFSQFIYGRNFPVMSEKGESLGESLSILTGMDNDNAPFILKNYPTTYYGTPCVFPQERDIPPYHNNGIWPFVEAFRMWAAKSVQNEDAVMHSLACIERASALFLTNKENFVAESGSNLGTEINSDRQLWSIAGNLSIVYRVIFGMEFHPGYLELKPFIPHPLKGTHELTNFHYGKATYSIKVSGEGNMIVYFKVDGKLQSKPMVAASVNGAHEIEIQLQRGAMQTGQNLIDNQFVCKTLKLVVADGEINWHPVPHAKEYIVYKNGKPLATIANTSFRYDPDTLACEYQAAAIDSHGEHSFLSEPVDVDGAVKIIPVHALRPDVGETVTLNSEVGDSFSFTLEIPSEGIYAIDFLYANGNGPINTDNKCALRSLEVDKQFAGVIVFPQRGNGNWDNYGYSNTLYLPLKFGQHSLQLVFEPLNRNMNGMVNSASIKAVRLKKINPSMN